MSYPVSLLVAALLAYVIGASPFGYLAGRPDFLDLALVYALMNFIGTIAAMKFTRFGDLAGMEDEDSEELF